MTKLLLTILFGSLMFAAASGCSNNGNVIGPNENSNVTFNITQEITQTGSMQFMFKPGTDIKISQITSKLPAEQFSDTLTYGNPNYLYSKDTTYIINRYVNVYAGQQWIFEFTGTVPGSNTQYNKAINYTVQ